MQLTYPELIAFLNLCYVDKQADTLALMQCLNASLLLKD